MKIFTLLIFFFLSTRLFSMEANTQIPVHYLKSLDFIGLKENPYVVGIRPYRLAGPRIEVEEIKNKKIIHAYGFGGSGLTLSWGAADQAINIFNKEEVEPKSVAILGAGVIGLTIAYELLKKGYSVTIYASQITENRTSDIGVGILSYPFMIDPSNQMKNIIDRMYEFSIKRFTAIMKKDTKEFEGAGFFEGIHMLPDYNFDESQSEWFKKDYKSDNDLGRLVLVEFENGSSRKAFYKEKMSMDALLYMRSLYKAVVDNEGVIQKKSFEDLDDVLSLSEDVIFNCTGYGSKTLFKDDSCVGVRGHLVYLEPQEGLYYSASMRYQEGSNTFFMLYPWADRIILGGSYEKGNELCEVSKDVIQALCKQAQEVFGSMEK